MRIIIFLSIEKANHQSVSKNDASRSRISTESLPVPTIPINTLYSLRKQVNVYLREPCAVKYVLYIAEVYYSQTPSFFFLLVYGYHK
jgi:hypothetical protein